MRDLADSRGKLFGTAVNGGLIDPEGSAPQVLRDILATEFNVYVAESRYKMVYVLTLKPSNLSAALFPINGNYFWQWVYWLLGDWEIRGATRGGIGLGVGFLPSGENGAGERGVDEC